jgi:hypothetical protein
MQFERASLIPCNRIGTWEPGRCRPQRRQRDRGGRSTDMEENSWVSRILSGASEAPENLTSLYFAIWSQSQRSWIDICGFNYLSFTCFLAIYCFAMHLFNQNIILVLVTWNQSLKLLQYILLLCVQFLVNISILPLKMLSISIII